VDYQRADRVLECRSDREYDEDAFSYFLAMERARAEHAKRPLRLLFASLEARPGTPGPFSPESAARLFEGLRRSLRDTDIVGWYRQGRVAGAILSAGDGRPAADGTAAIEERVGECLRQCLPPKEAGNLKLSAVEFGPQRQRLPSRVGRTLKV